MYHLKQRNVLLVGYVPQIWNPCRENSYLDIIKDFSCADEIMVPLELLESGSDDEFKFKSHNNKENQEFIDTRKIKNSVNENSNEDEASKVITAYFSETIEMAEMDMKFKSIFKETNGVFEVIFEYYHFESIPDLCNTVDSLPGLPESPYIIEQEVKRGEFINGAKAGYNLYPGNQVHRKIDNWFGPGDEIPGYWRINENKNYNKMEIDVKEINKSFERWKKEYFEYAWMMDDAQQRFHKQLGILYSKQGTWSRELVFDAVF